MSRKTIAVIADIHYGIQGPAQARLSLLAAVLLERTVHRLNRMIKPDVTVLLGDLLDAGDSPGYHDFLSELREALDKLDCPWIAIPGNHDPEETKFYSVMPRSDEVVDIDDLRILPFVDQDEPGYNASRSKEDILRFRRARADHAGPIVALQHVCLAPPELADAPYNYTNAPDIVAAMDDAGVALSIAAHHHRGSPDIRHGSTTFMTVPALCEVPFCFTIVTLDGDKIESHVHHLVLPPGLVDSHIHTELAYCSRDVTVPKVIELAQALGLEGLGFAEHSGQLYFNREDYWGGNCLSIGAAGAPPCDNRMAQYFALKAEYASADVHFGSEVDCDFNGQLLATPKDIGQFEHLIGSVHRTPGSKNPDCPTETVNTEFLTLVEQLLQQGVFSLAHPFRVFGRSNREVSSDLFQPTARLLQKYNVAAEINFHTNNPPAEFVQLCLELGVKLSFGSDAHALYEVGEFAPHLQLLENVGYNGDLPDILASPWSTE